MAQFVMIRESRCRIRKEQHQYHMAPREEPLDMIMVEQMGKRFDPYNYHQEFTDESHFQKPYDCYDQKNHVGHKGPYLHATVVHDQQQPCAYRGPPVQTRIAPKGPLMQVQNYEEVQNYPQANMVSSQVPQVIKKQVHAIDCNEAAKLYGGVVFTDYGRTNNKLSLRT
ncbi:hypothetical protein TorRG33x02_160700 [Trema orientale]|uniref:Uncharacterized protein n=1 Tax=Trema orientale TaxID=63057 RepID=A0A2P5ERT0_TREOI|nr:hypothetical protein TorRG33x02_160700 [Trema orientale]